MTSRLIEQQNLPQVVDTDELNEPSSTPEIRSSTGFITALWASGGLGILSMPILDDGLARMGLTEWATIIPFVFGIYAASYLFGGILSHKSVRRNIFVAALAALLVSELVLLSGSVVGGLGYIASSLVEGSNNMTSFHGLSEVFSTVGALTIFGAMFTAPLSVGLGAHVRIAEYLRTRRAALEDLSEHDAEVEPGALLPGAR